MGAFLIEETALESPVHEPGKKGSNTHTSRFQKSGSKQVVEFVIGDELFAVDLFDTREVINTPEVTPIPNTPSYITGMIDLRGVITTIIDLRVMMHITRESTGKKRSRVIVLDKTVSEKMLGILVDDVFSVTTYSKDDIDQEAQSSNESHRDILGVIRKHKKDGGKKDKSALVIWLDIKTMIRRVEKDL
ncbi:MAG TPA: chemotaxis protein CheW [Methanospirillum sp.]|uniref:chemotaxis protein CheW n=1 Tax=Methanospirillum sp. TaxID=45200 RepID=UPI002B513FC5|nr:chemotaxis protein CheW [Methanospirillum sp.]HWQ64365.1 chemotaxis protein CheW [Methanospirillum sp.]